MNLERFTKYEEDISVIAEPCFPEVCPQIELETVGNVNHLMSKRDWVFWSGTTAGSIGFTGVALGAATLNPVLMIAGGITFALGTISMAGAALCHRFCPIKSKLNLENLELLQNIESINEIEVDTPKNPQLAPQPIFNKDGTVYLLRPAPLTRNLILTGGGVKGRVYLPFLEILDKEYNIIQNLLEISGASAGSIMGFLLAAGVPFQELKEYLENADMIQQLRGESIRELEHGFGIFSANALTENIREKTSRAANSYFEENPDALEELSMNIENLDFVTRAYDGFKNGLKFRDLTILHKLHPEKFKHLHVTGYNKTLEITEYYNFENTPDMYCNDAVRISMAIPVVIKAVIIDGHEKTDGGQGDNAPLGVFRQRKDYNPAENLMLVFERKGAMARVLHGPPGSTARSILERILTSTARKVTRFVYKVVRTISALFGKIIPEDAPKIKNDESVPYYGKMPSVSKRIILGEKYVQSKKREQEGIYSLGPNALIVPHGKLKTTSFTASKEILDAAEKEAIAAAKVYNKIRKNNGVCTSHESVDSAIKSLTKAEKELIRNLEIDSSWPTAEKNFYEAVRNVG